METTSYIALSRQAALRREMTVVSNNIANMNTTGYKGERMMFVDHLERSRSGDFIADQKLNFVRDVASYRNLEEGNIQQTGNPLDLAIHGEGYFVVQTPDGEQQYTRGGSLRLDENGQLVTQGGLPVLTDANTPIFFAPEDTKIEIASDGSVSTQNGAIGKLQVVRFENEQDMQRVENGLYTTEQPAEAVEAPTVAQGALEQSNVQAILEMSRMIQVNRSYKSIQNLIQKEDERLKKAIAELAKVQQS